MAKLLNCSTDDIKYSSTSSKTFIKNLNIKKMKSKIEILKKQGITEDEIKWVLLVFLLMFNFTKFFWHVFNFNFDLTITFLIDKILTKIY